MAADVNSGLLEFSDDQKVFVAVDEDDVVQKAVLIDREGNETALGALPTDEQVQEAVDAWLDDHPEATTTVQDGAITTAKLADGSVTDDKLAADGIKAEVSDLKTDLGGLKYKLLGDNSEVFKAERYFTSGTGISASTKFLPIRISAGEYYSFKFIDESGAIASGNNITLYRWDAQNNRTSISSFATNTLFAYKSLAEVYAFSIYIPDGKVTNNGTLKLVVEVQKASNNRLSANNLESGAYTSGSGVATKANDRVRMVKPIVCGEGATIISNNYYFDAFEYDIVTGAYITSNGSWTKRYTVQNDSAVMLVWQTTISNKDAIVNSTVFAPNQSVLFNTSYPINELKDITKLNTLNFLQSDTIKSISHRGNYLRCQGMMCGGSAVISAKRAGYRIVENDVALTSDGKMVMWHDDTLSAIGDSTHGVADYTLAQLKAMDFGTSYGSQFAGEQILTFGEWIAICKKVGVDCYIDFKVSGDEFTDAMAEEMVETIKHYGMLNHVSYAENFSKIRQYHADARLLILNTPTQELITTYTPYLASGEVIFNPKSSTLNSTNAQLVLDNGFGLECWYVDYGTSTQTEIFTEIERVVDLGVQGMTLDIFRVEDVFNAKYSLIG